MKTLLDVTKTLLLINGVIVLPSLLLFHSMYQQQLMPMAEVPQDNDSSSKFHRHLQDDSLNYQQELKKTKQQLEQFKTETDSQITALQTALKKSQSQNPVNGTIAPSSLPNLPTVEPVTAYQPLKQTPTPQTVLPKKITPVSSPTPSNPRTSQKVEPVSPPQETVIPKSTEVKEAYPAAQPSQSQKEETTIYPKQHISINNLPAINRNPLESYGHTLKDDESRELASSLHEGLVVAQNEGHINPGTTNYKKVRKAIETLKNGQSQTLKEAAESSGIESSVLVQVNKWGENYAQSRQLAHEIQVGLTVAHKENQINYGTSNYKKVQTAIFLLRNGKIDNLQEAARLSGVTPSVLQQLAKWGEYRRDRFALN
ncbi:MAG: hypothetical protein AB4062_13420 [Crocosphaera sp.]